MKGMRICVTARPDLDRADHAGSVLRLSQLRPAGDLAPELALPWVVRLRYGMALGQVGLLLVARYALDADLPVLPLAAPVGVMLVTNAALSRLGRSLTNARALFGLLFLLDTILLTVVLGFTGGPTNPFTLLYLVQITLSAVILNRIWTWLIGLLSTIAFAFLFWVHRPFPLMDPADHGHMHPAHIQGMFIAFTVAAVLLSFFIGKVSEILRKAEQDILDLKDRAAKNDRLTSLVTLAAGAAHELATPLGTIAVVANELEHRAERSSRDPDLLADARLVRSEIERCRLILQRMSGRDTDAAVEPAGMVQIGEVLEAARQEFSKDEQQRIGISDETASATVFLPEQSLRRALVLLTRNALDADVRGRVEIRAGTEGRGVRFTIEDHGPGMSPEVLNRIAEPFFTTKDAGRGMGLGTFLARTLAERLDGVLMFDSVPGAGTRVTLDVPASPRVVAENAQR